MRNEIFKILKNIGFKFYEKSETPIGVALEYKYYPKYLTNTHYTLVLFIYKGAFFKDYRLYIHNNSDGSFADGVFQLSDDAWNIKYMKKDISETFKIELRRLKLKRTLK